MLSVLCSVIIYNPAPTVPYFGVFWRQLSELVGFKQMQFMWMMSLWNHLLLPTRDNISFDYVTTKILLVKCTFCTACCARFHGDETAVPQADSTVPGFRRWERPLDFETVVEWTEKSGQRFIQIMVSPKAWNPFHQLFRGVILHMWMYKLDSCLKVKFIIQTENMNKLTSGLVSI